MYFAPITSTLRAPVPAPKRIVNSPSPRFTGTDNFPKLDEIKQALKAKGEAGKNALGPSDKEFNSFIFYVECATGERYKGNLDQLVNDLLDPTKRSQLKQAVAQYRSERESWNSFYRILPT